VCVRVRVPAVAIIVAFCRKIKKKNRPKSAIAVYYVIYNNI